MRYLLIILLFPLLSFGQRVKYVNGVAVPLTQSEIVQVQRDSTVADSTARDSTNVQKTRIEKRITERQDKLFRAYVIVAVKLNKANTDAFVAATRQERNDYPYNPDLLIAWITVTFPTKPYFDADLQTRLLNILQ